MYTHIMLLYVDACTKQPSQARYIYRCGQRLRTELDAQWCMNEECQNLLFEDISEVLQLSPRATMACRKVTIDLFSLDTLPLILSIASRLCFASPSDTIPSSFCFSSTLSSSLPLCCWCWHAVAALCWPWYEPVKLLVPLQHRGLIAFLGVMNIST